MKKIGHSLWRFVLREKDQTATVVYCVPGSLLPSWIAYRLGDCYHDAHRNDRCAT